jgi:hypothetical protein
VSAASPAAAAAARQFWQRAGCEWATPAEAAAATDRALGQLHAGLVRWVGSAGYTALASRSLVIAAADQPVLRGLSGLGRDGPAIQAAAQEHGVGQLRKGLMLLIATLIDLLGHIVGEEMAIHLVEHASTRALPGDRNRETPTESKGNADA